KSSASKRSAAGDGAERVVLHAHPSSLMGAGGLPLESVPSHSSIAPPSDCQALHVPVASRRAWLRAPSLAANTSTVPSIHAHANGSTEESCAPKGVSGCQPFEIGHVCETAPLAPRTKTSGCASSITTDGSPFAPLAIFANGDHAVGERVDS